MSIARPFAVGLAVTAVLASGFAPAIAAPTPAPSSAASTKSSITLTPPNSGADAAVFTVTGLASGAKIEGSAGRRDDAQAETVGVAYADASGKAVLRLPAPSGGWRMGATYIWGVSTGHTGRFTYATDDPGTINQPTAKPSSTATTSKAPASQAPASKAPTGGLAKTGF